MSQLRHPATVTSPPCGSSLFFQLRWLLLSPGSKRPYFFHPLLHGTCSAARKWVDDLGSVCVWIDGVEWRQQQLWPQENKISLFAMKRRNPKNNSKQIVTNGAIVITRISECMLYPPVLRALLFFLQCCASLILESGQPQNIQGPILSLSVVLTSLHSSL